MLCKLQAGQDAADAAWRAQVGAGKAVEVSLEKGQFREALKIFGACGGPVMSPHGVNAFLRGWRAKKGASLVDKSATGAPVGAGPATLGLGPLRRSSNELCLPDGATQTTTVATAVQAAVVLTLILALALTWIGALGCASGRLTAVRAVGSSPSHGSLGWAVWLKPHGPCKVRAALALRPAPRPCTAPAPS